MIGWLITLYPVRGRGTKKTTQMREKLCALTWIIHQESIQKSERALKIAYVRTDLMERV